MSLEKFIVLELRGARVLVELNCDMSIKPNITYFAEHMMLS